MRKVLKYLAFLALAVILLHFSFKGVEWDDFVVGLQSCNWWWILLSMAIGILGFFLRALRWRLLLLSLNKDVTIRETFDGVNIGYITNFVFPRAGEVARCGVVAKSRKVSFEGSLGTVVLERGIDMVCLLLWTLLLLLFRWGEFGTFIGNEIWQPLQEKFNSAVWPILIFMAFFVAGIAAVLILRRRLMEIRVFRKAFDLARGLLKGLLTAFRMEYKWLFIIYTLLIWLTCWLTSYTTIFAFPQVGHLTGVDALFLMIVGGFGWVVPVQGGLGAYHFIVSLALAKVYGIAQATGVVFATISHEAQALAMILCGVVSLISVSLWKRK